MSFHTILYAGNLGRDAEMRYTPQGTAVANFSVAVDDSYKDASGERIKRTVWVRTSIWGKFAEAMTPYLIKGQKVLVEGKLVHDENGNPRTFTRNDGTPGAAFEVRASTVRLLGAGSSSGTGEVEEGEAGEPSGALTPEENIPF